MGHSRHADYAAIFIATVLSAALAASCGGAEPTASKTPAAGTETTARTVTQPAAEPTGQPSAPAAPSAAATAERPAGQAATSAETAAETEASPAAPSAPEAPARRLGEIVFAEGTVTVQRAGASPERADIGSVVLAYDVLVTGPKSRAEVDIGSGSAGGATVKLAENTAFYFDTDELDAEQRKTTLQLLSGALAIKVDRLANGSFSVGTDSAVLGVRGTVFIVDTVPDGALLVSCESGAVSVSDGASTTTAKPGAVVELTDAVGLKLLAVQPEELGPYRGGWKTDAYKAFAPKALSYTSGYAAAIDAGKPGFESALAALSAQEKTLDEWRKARAAGKEPRFTDWIPEKKAVAAVLFDCLKALFSLERPYYRLIELKTLHDAGTGVGTLKDGRSSVAYFKSFEASNAKLALGMARVREALMLFSWASADSPAGEFFGSKAESLGTGALMLGD
jgi:ferric-dicitrate binding protein FerR (iron transport regulator)